MKICPHCGATNFDTWTTCEKCNQPLLMTINSPLSKESGVSKAAKILLKIETIMYGALFCVFFLIWLALIIIAKELSYYYDVKLVTFEALLYMNVVLLDFVFALLTTITYNEKIALQKPIKMRFIIFVLLFINAPAGILMIIDHECKKH